MAPSHVIHHLSAAAEGVGFDADLVQQADVEVAERSVVFAVFEDVASVLEAAAGEDHGEVLAGVRRGVAEVAHVENRRVVEEGGVGLDRKSTRLNSSHIPLSRMPSSA